MKKKITFNDIAKKTKFSKTTISRYFNNPDSLTEESKKKIENALVELDYKENKVIDMNTKEESKTGLPISNVLYFELENNGWCCVRPSGTEPKIKFYVGVKSDSLENSEKEMNELLDHFTNRTGAA